MDWESAIGIKKVIFEMNQNDHQQKISAIKKRAFIKTVRGKGKMFHTGI